VATTRRLKRSAVYLTLRFASAVLAILPERAAIELGRLGGWLAWLFAGERKKMADRHMRRVGAGDEAPEQARKVFVAYGRYWAEALWMRPRRARSVVERVTVDGLERVTDARDAGTGMVFALPHVGNWEVAGTIARREEIELVAVAEKLGSKRLVEWFSRLRNMLGIQIVLADGSREVFRELFGVIGRGGAVALVTDRDLSGRGAEVEFFGEKTTLPTGAITLGIRTGAPVLPVGSFFGPRRGHHIVVGPPVEIPTEGSMDERMAAGMTALAAALEKLVRLAPEQWHLLQPNWPSDREPA
jgi:KDO2-lipid IV(A) lauroyltransferase